MHRVHELVLRHPATWLVPAHPERSLAEAATETWLREQGVLIGSRDARKFTALDVAGYAGSPFGRGPLERLTTVARYLALWIFHDDVIEGHGGVSAERLAAAIRGDAAALGEASELERPWLALGLTFRTCMSGAWRVRHAERFAAWVRSLDAEAELLDRARASGHAPSVQDYLAMRLVNIGVLPTLGFLEYLEGRELAPALLDDPDLAAIEQLAALLVTIINDLGGLTKDIEGGWLNLALSLAHERGVDAHEAAELLASSYEARALELERIGARLIVRHGAPARAWVEGVQHMVAGFVRWHIEAPRYAARESGVRLVLPIATLEQAA